MLLLFFPTLPYTTSILTMFTLIWSDMHRCPLNYAEAGWDYRTSWSSLVCFSSFEDSVNYSLAHCLLLQVIIVPFIFVFVFVCCGGGPVALSSSCSMLPRSTHETFAESLYREFKNHTRFSKPKLARSDFTICHYAGDVSIIYTFRCILHECVDSLSETAEILVYKGVICSFVR